MYTRGIARYESFFFRVEKVMNGRTDGRTGGKIVPTYTNRILDTLTKDPNAHTNGGEEVVRRWQGGGEEVVRRW